jgi:dihydroorotase
MELVVDGNCFVSGRMQKCCVGIEGGKIVKIAKVLEGEKVLNFGNKLVLPAAIDGHVHFREPGMTDKEDFASGSEAALCGGVTCVLEMPNTRPSTTTVASIREKKKAASAKSLVDFGLFAGVKPGMDVEALAKEAAAFKLYMGSTTGDLLVPDILEVKKELARIARTGKVLAVHAEDENLRRKDPENDLEGHLRNRPNECETTAIKTIRNAYRGDRLHICHVSARQSLFEVKGRTGLTCEVTPHHLLFDTTSRLGALIKVNPPIRRREDRQALFQALKGGSIDMVASDHAPHLLEEKEDDFEYALTGTPGVETLVPLMLQLVRENHLAIDLVIRMLCERPGEIYGLPKGRIAAGYDADLIVVDMLAGEYIKADKLHSKCGWTAYEDMPAIFPKAVFLRGELMVENRSRVGERKGRDIVGST